MKDGQPAYEPELERFALGQRILDGLTQQSAIGVTATGTTLLVVAETMRASELVPSSCRSAPTAPCASIAVAAPRSSSTASPSTAAASAGW